MATIMPHTSTVKSEAIRLRRHGTTIKDVAKLLDIAVGTAHSWVKDVKLSASVTRRLRKQHRERLRPSQLRGAEVNRTKHELIRAKYIQEGYEKAKCEHSFRMLCALYWGEGTKARNEFSISNCDPDLLRCVGSWLREEGHDRIHFCVSYYPTSGLVKAKVISWWRDKLACLPADAPCTATILAIKRGSQAAGIGKRPYGTAVLRVHSTKLV